MAAIIDEVMDTQEPDQIVPRPEPDMSQDVSLPPVEDPIPRLLYAIRLGALSKALADKRHDRNTWLTLSPQFANITKVPENHEVQDAMAWIKANLAPALERIRKAGVSHADTEDLDLVSRLKKRRRTVSPPPLPMPVPAVTSVSSQDSESEGPGSDPADETYEEVHADHRSSLLSLATGRTTRSDTRRQEIGRRGE